MSRPLALSSEVFRSRSVIGAKMAHDLADGIQLQPRALDVLGSLRLDIRKKAGEDRLIQGREIVAADRFARRDRDRTALGDGEHATANRAEMAVCVGAFPADHRDCQAGEEIGVSRQNAEAAGSILGAQCEDTVLVDDH